MRPSKQWYNKFNDLTEISKQMGQMTPEAVVDELGVLKELEKKLLKKTKALTAWLKNKAEHEEVDSYKGEEYFALLAAVEQERFSQEKAKAHLTEEQIANCMYTLEFQKLLITPNTQK